MIVAIPKLITDADPQLASQMRQWRHAIHAYPETAFEEVQTAALTSEQLRNLGRMHACGHDGHTAMLLGAVTPGGIRMCNLHD